LSWPRFRRFTRARQSPTIERRAAERNTKAIIMLPSEFVDMARAIGKTETAAAA